MRALIIGATEATGKDLVDVLEKLAKAPQTLPAGKHIIELERSSGFNIFVKAAIP